MIEGEQEQKFMKPPSLRRSAKVVTILSVLRPPATCDFGKSLLSGQRMNRPIGIMCLRPVVGSLAATAAAILLYGFNHADAQAPQGIGIMYLTPSDQVGQPYHNLSGAPEWRNSAVQGVTLRTQWARVEPYENDFYWGYLDQGVLLGAQYGKKIAILITAGVNCPQWLFDAGAPAFNVTTEHGYSAITDGVTAANDPTVISAGDTAGWNSVSVGLKIFGGSIPAGATIVTVNSSSNVTISAPATASATGVAITTAQILPMPLPWDPIFQQKWGAFVQAFAARYGNSPNLAYVVMGGPGRNEEAYFCFTPYDIDYFINTLGGLPNWELGVKWIIDQYGTYFPNKPFMLAMANPIPTDDGQNSLDAVVAYGAAQYPGNHFGVMSCGLQYPSGPDPGSNGAQWIPLLSPTSTVGFCFYGPQGPYTDPVTGRFMLDLGLERGFNFGAHFIEVYALDCNIPILAPVLQEWGAILTTTPPIPAAPSGLTATATSSSMINLGWVDNATNEIGERIERSVGSNANYTFLANVGIGITTFTDTGLLDGTLYYYRIKAFNTGGFSTYSNEQSALTPLNSPTSLTATAVSSSEIDLTWADTSASESGYRIEQSPVDDLHFTEIGVVPANQTFFNATRLSEGTKYYYRVRAYNALTISAYSSEKNATTLWNIPVAPSGLRITSISSGTVNLAWIDNSGDESGFKIQRKQGATGIYSQIGTVGANVTIYTDSDSALLDGTKYYYQVWATNPAGNSPYSNEVNGITTMRVPTGLVATAVSSSQINLTWTDNSLAEDGYKIEQSPVDDLHFVEIHVTAPNATSYNVIGLNAGTKYYYRVRAYNSITTSAYSSEKNATTLSNIPVAPSGLTITTITSGSVSLAWTDNSNNETGFKVQRKGATGIYTTIRTVAANVTTYTDSDSALLDGTQYYYKVCATNSAGDSPFSNEVNGITTMRVPTGLVATAVSSSQINLTWTDNSWSESGYKIDQSPVDDLHFVEIHVTAPNVTSYNVTGLNAGTKYYYRVRA
ncbi:MAG: fibronectin type III domain-containing protein, partial [Candidatus Udaeobacter sp.]